MRNIHSLLVISAGTLLFMAAAGSSSAQSPATPGSQFSLQSLADMKTLNQLIGDIQGQQKAIADNQALIDQKLAALAETIRTARIFAKRGGGSPQ